MRREGVYPNFGKGKGCGKSSGQKGRIGQEREERRTDMLAVGKACASRVVAKRWHRPERKHKRFCDSERPQEKKQSSLVADGAAAGRTARHHGTTLLA